MVHDLSQKEIRFCDEYLISFNATQSAIKAGYSKKTAASIASENLKKPKIQRYLQGRKQKMLQKLEISQERTMQEIGRIAFADPRQLFNEDGSLIPIPKLSEDQAAVISSFEMEELFQGTGKDRKEVGTTKKVKLWSKPAALEMLAKHYKIFEDAPPPATVNVNGLTSSDLKTILALKKKVSK